MSVNVNEAKETGSGGERAQPQFPGGKKKEKGGGVQMARNMDECRIWEGVWEGKKIWEGTRSEQ